MKTFKFTLETLLTLREMREQQALQDYSQALLTLEQATTKLESVRTELEQSWIHFEKLLAANCPAPAAELAQIQDHCQMVAQRVKRCERIVHYARLKAHETFLGLLAARRDSAVLDKRLEKQKHRYDRARRRKNQKALDEMAGRGYALIPLWQVNRDALWN